MSAGTVNVPARGHAHGACVRHAATSKRQISIDAKLAPWRSQVSLNVWGVFHVLLLYFSSHQPLILTGYKT